MIESRSIFETHSLRAANIFEFGGKYSLVCGSEFRKIRSEREWKGEFFYIIEYRVRKRYFGHDACLVYQPHLPQPSQMENVKKKISVSRQFHILK